MRIKNRFAFNANEKNVINFLERENISYEKSELSVVFELFEDHDKFGKIKQFMEFHNAVIIPEAVYTNDEINSAQWLAIRSRWVNLYPQPQESMKYRFTTYDSTDYCEGVEPIYRCRKGLIQKESFVLNKEPNWGTRNFMMLNWIEDELFISLKAEEVLTASTLTGFDIYDVLSKQKMKFKNIKQIFVNKYLSQGFCADAIKQKLICTKCGFTKYLPKVGYLCFNKSIFERVEEDIVKTTDKFGEVNCYSMIFITHKFYEIITQARIDRGLVFEPIVLI